MRIGSWISFVSNLKGSRVAKSQSQPSSNTELSRGIYRQWKSSKNNESNDDIHNQITGDNNERGVGFEEKYDPKSPPPDSNPSLDRTSELLKNRQDEEKARANKIKAVEDAAAANMSGNGLLGKIDQKTTKWQSSNHLKPLLASSWHLIHNTCNRLWRLFCSDLY